MLFIQHLMFEFLKTDTASSNDFFSGMSNTSTATVEAQDAPAASSVTDEDNFFNQKAPTTAEKKTMDKNSIMALYNQSTTTPNANMFSTVPGNMYGAIASPMTPVTPFGQTGASPMTSLPAFGQAGTSSMTSVPVFGQAGTSSMTSVPAYGQTGTSSMTSIPAFGQTGTSSMTSVPAFGQTAAAPMTSIPTFSQAAVSPMGARPTFGQVTPTSMNSVPSMMAPGYNPMMQGNMFPNQMFPTNGQVPTAPIPQMTQLSQQMMGLNMAPSPMMYQPNPNVAPLNGAQFIPGRMSNPSTMGTQAAAQVNNPYAFLSSGQTLSTNMWQ